MGRGIIFFVFFVILLSIQVQVSHERHEDWPGVAGYTHLDRIKYGFTKDELLKFTAATRAGWTVEQVDIDGRNCHCRVASSSSTFSSSSSSSSSSSVDEE